MPAKPILIVVDNVPINPATNAAFSTSLNFLRDTHHVLIIHRIGGAANFYKVMNGSELAAQDATDLNTILGI